MNRRKFFGASTGAALAAPSVVREAAALSAVPGVPYPHLDHGYAGQTSASDYWQSEVDQMRKDLALLDSDPDAMVGTRGHYEAAEMVAIDGMRSVSPSAKARMRAAAYRRNEIRDRKAWLERSIAEKLRQMAGFK